MSATDNELEGMVAGLHHKIHGRLFGKYRGLVVDNADPEKLGRLRLRVPSLFGNQVVTGWANACAPYGGADDQGMLMIPDLQAGVWVEFEEGHPDQPIWTGTYWSAPPGPIKPPRPDGGDGSEAGEVQDPPTCKIWKTRAGHTIQLEDKDGEEAIVIVEGKHKHLVRFDHDGIAIQDAAGNSLVMTSDAVTLTAKAALTIDASGQALVIKASSIDFQKA